MPQVTIQHAGGHPRDAWVGETSSAAGAHAVGGGAAAAALKQQACPAGREAGMGPEATVAATRRAGWDAVRVYLDDPLFANSRNFWAVMDAMRAYEAAWEDLEQERNR